MNEKGKFTRLILVRYIIVAILSATLLILPFILTDSILENKWLKLSWLIVFLIALYVTFDYRKRLILKKFKVRFFEINLICLFISLVFSFTFSYLPYMYYYEFVAKYNNPVLKANLKYPRESKIILDARAAQMQFENEIWKKFWEEMSEKPIPEFASQEDSRIYYDVAYAKYTWSMPTEYKNGIRFVNFESLIKELTGKNIPILDKTLSYGEKLDILDSIEDPTKIIDNNRRGTLELFATDKLYTLIVLSFVFSLTINLLFHNKDEMKKVIDRIKKTMKFLWEV